MGGEDRLSFLGRPGPRNLRLRTLTLQPRDALDYRPGDWVDTLVVVERGELELECQSGVRAWFGQGAVLVLAELGLRRLRNSSSTPLVLSALSRIRSAER
jgi:hypothetical protein